MLTFSGWIMGLQKVTALQGKTDSCICASTMTAAMTLICCKTFTFGSFASSGEAENIIASEHDRLDLPLGTPTFESIEKARRAKSGLISLLEK